MTEARSCMLDLGFIAEDFSLLEPLNGEKKSFNTLSKDAVATLVIFMCNHCPFVLHIIDRLNEVYDYFAPKGVVFIGINSNDIVQYPEDSPERMVSLIEKHKIKFPYLYDETQEVAKKYQAACTPDLYVFDRDKKLAYRGRFDASVPFGDSEVSGVDIISALNAIVTLQQVPTPQYPSIGCNIKWKYEGAAEFMGI